MYMYMTYIHMYNPLMTTVTGTHPFLLHAFKCYKTFGRLTEIMASRMSSR